MFVLDEGNAAVLNICLLRLYSSVKVRSHQTKANVKSLQNGTSILSIIYIAIAFGSNQRKCVFMMTTRVLCDLSALLPHEIFSSPNHSVIPTKSP